MSSSGEKRVSLMAWRATACFGLALLLAPCVWGEGTASLGGGDMVEVPDVVGQGIELAEGILAESGLNVGEIGHGISEFEVPGTVLWQEPPPGTVVPLGTSVNLVVAKAPGEKVEVPDVVGHGIDMAERILAEFGLEVGEVGHGISELEDPGTVLWQEPAAGTVVFAGSAVRLVIAEAPGDTVQVPDVIGKGIDKAGHILAEFGLRVGEISHRESELERGTVLVQEPAAGTLVSPETAVHLVVSAGMGDKVEVPMVLELNIDVARQVLAERGLTVGEVTHRESEAEAGTVIAQEPAPGTLVSPETAVHLVVSSGMGDKVEVPNVVGKGIDNAGHILAERGLTVGEVSHKKAEAEAGTVIAQDPAPGTLVSPETAVHLVISSGLGEKVEVPSVLELGIDMARNVLAERGLTVGEVSHKESEAEAGTVIAQDPSPGTLVHPEARVHLVVSSGIGDKVEVPNVVGKGIDNAGHIFAEFGLRVGDIAHQESELDRGTVIAQEPAPGTLVSPETAVHLVISSGIGDKVEVPSVLELGIDAARHALAERGLTVGQVTHRESEAEAGTVIAQEPTAGDLVPPETAVHLVVSSGIGEKVEVPSVLELGIDAARHVIAERGLIVGEVTHRESEAEAGTVIAQEPTAGDLVPPETAVHLVVSSGIGESVEVPGVIELHADAAQQAIAEAGLVVGEVAYAESELEPGTVIDQEPAAGTLVPTGTAVHIVVASETGDGEKSSSPRAFATIDKEENTISLTWQAFGSGQYIVQWTHDLASGVWLAVPTRDSTQIGWTDYNIGGARKRFYRVISQ